VGTIDTIAENFRSRAQDVVKRVQTSIFGVNNEKLDFILDSFYKLSPPQRTGVLAGIVVGIFAFVSLAVILYFVRVNALEAEFNASRAAKKEIASFKENFRVEQEKYDSLVTQVTSRIRAESIKTFAAKLAEQQGLTLEPGNPKDVPLPPENPLSEKIQEVHLELKLRKVSIPRLLKFVMELEKSRYFIKVQDLKIDAIFGTKMYFNADIRLRGYRPV
jgi:hypothetical protein